MREGFFIVFEGPDGSGKSTQADLLYRSLSRDGYPCVITEEPGGTAEGIKIREILLNPELTLCPKAELFLFLADRTEHVCRVIQPALQQGKIVICSRYYYSTLVYQGMARKIADMEFLEQMNLYAVDHIQPDVVFYLDVSPEQGLSKALDKSGGDRIEREGVDFQHLVRQGYIELASRHKDTFVVVNEGSIEEISNRVYGITKRRLMND